MDTRTLKTDKDLRKFFGGEIEIFNASCTPSVLPRYGWYRFGKIKKIFFDGNEIVVELEWLIEDSSYPSREEISPNRTKATWKKIEPKPIVISNRSSYHEQPTNDLDIITFATNTMPEMFRLRTAKKAVLSQKEFQSAA